ncbi:hypothetical protein QEZ52_20910 (plasmid) [Aliisedimentitalea scapharcae]|uniref:Lipoprotein n=1 Tax=Aliisedimentitalea scapharcae TaxID=1524259 RepID=A0ABZ2XZA4_9RHOB
MQKKLVTLVAALSLMAGCSEQLSGTGGAAPKTGNLPDSVVELAAPGQDLATAHLLPQDNCYWYEHSGPVEVTLLPLRATNGGPICLAAQS